MPSTADVIFTGGSIFTSRTGNPERLGVAVAEGRIVSLGSDDEVMAMAGDRTRLVDLDGALLIPGFQDAHIHPVAGGMELMQCDLTEAKSSDEALRTIAEYAEANPDSEWILGAGWTLDQFPGGTPVRGDLDRIIPDRPVLLANRDHHSMWANTRAFELAGLDQHSPDPVGGRIEREPNGFPAGTVHEYAMELFKDVRPVIDLELAHSGLLRAQEEMLALGITAWQDARLGVMLGSPDTVLAYRQAISEGALKVDVVGAQWWERSEGIEQMKAFDQLRSEVAEQYSDGSFRVGTVKIMVDGVAESFTAAMSTPYLDPCGHPTDNSGFSYVDPENLKAYVTALDDAGFQIHFHAIGDRAVREALDAVEAARLANGPSDNRHHLAHLQIVDEVDAPRFAELDVVVNMQALWACHEPQMDDLTLPFMSPGADMRHFPFGEILAGGARLAAGSDWPVTSANPIEAIHVAVNRVAPRGDAKPLGDPGQRLTLAEALTAYTSGSAYVNHRDHDSGSIEVGFLANLAVLEPNPFEVAPEDIHATTVTSTWIRGSEVYFKSRPSSN